MQNLPEDVKENVLLKDYSTFKIGGNAKYLCVAKTEEEVKIALDFAIENKSKIFVIGKGSNLLISDKGFDGLVLKIDDQEIEIKEVENGFEAKLGCGVYLTKFILDIAKDGISGLEWAAGIPATLGGAVCNNAGAHGKDMSESIKSVKAIEMKINEKEKYLESYEMREILKDECEFSYRESVFKEKKNSVILGATLTLQKGDASELQRTIEENMKNRREKQPLEYPNAGSIFKNPVLSDAEMNRLFEKCPIVKDTFKNNTIPAGWLIEHVGLKGKKIGGSMVSEKHANFIVNVGDATAEDVIILISLIKQKVRVKFDIQLNEEIEYVGF
jgi:UDP-N-acetylmuramate dehydrogenase